MRRVAAILSIMFGLTVLTISTSRTLMKRISDYRNTAPWGAWWGDHQVHSGDLARMAYLEEMDKFKDTNKTTYTKAGDGNKTVNLYLWGDSYVKDIPDSALYGLKSFHFGRRDYTDLTYILDTSEKNILILSMGERFVRTVLTNTDIIYQQVKKEEQVQPAFLLPLQIMSEKNYAGMFDNKYFDVENLFNPAINQNIEYNLFSYNFASPVRVFKAHLNAKIFQRASGDVMISENGDYLFLKQTVLPGGYLSSYTPLTHDDISYFISRINEVYEHYKAEGFDEVYFSMIPNTASVMQPAYYDSMIPKMQEMNRGYALKIPIIDVYSVFTQYPWHYYLRNDTHWNHYGREVWINKVNALLKQWDDGTYAPNMVW